MISAFVILFFVALLSLAFHRSILLKPLALLSIIVSISYTLSGVGVALVGFETNESIKLFEVILELVLFAIVLHVEDDTTITQSLFIGASSILLLQSTTVLSYVLSFEALSIISIVLVSHIKTSSQAEGAVKMFIAAALATGILFLGLMFYLMGGADLLQPIQSTNIFETIGLFIMLSGVFYKLTIVPFHGWAADSYALVRNSHASILTGIAKTVVALATFKIFAPFILANLEISIPYLIILTVLTITLGNFLALFQNNLAKILAYSSIAHAGYMLLAFVAVESEYAKDGILYMSIAYVFMQSASFLVLDILKDKYNITTLDELKGFASQNRVLAFFFTIQLLSLAGVPLLAGFLAKAVVFYAGVDAGYWYVVLIALLNSALSVAYYAWIIKGIYFDKLTKEKSFVSVGLPIVSQIILVVATVYFGIFASLIFDVV
jgi:NADH-quinone oxidoreductase subunit N